MNPTRLKQIEEIYHAVVDRGRVDRAAIFDAHCGEDVNLRREVESLLTYEEISDSFIDAPPDAIAAEMFSEKEGTQGLIGKFVGHYSIKNLLGVGGMGEVYLADDTRLNRKVALKLLPPNLIERGDQLKRFKLEAQAASALNHPNILTIHEFGTENGSDYIVTEFVDGYTLRQKMQAGTMTVTEILDVAMQVASALAAAHEAGIVHRDIKPENMMIRRDGIVKVLDFGLAKLTVPVPPASSNAAEAQTLFRTAPGIVMGTVGYMSPEQARGVHIDGRTDIWSLGVVIYEMTAGHLPFLGATKTDILVAILKQPVPPIDAATARVPSELARIIDKALAKDVGERYQRDDELAADLKNLKNRLEFHAELRRPEIYGSHTVEGQETQTETRTKLIYPLAVEAQVSQHAALNEGTSGRAPGKRFLFFAAAVLIVLAGAIGAFVWISDKTVPTVRPTAPATLPSAPGAAETTPRMLVYSLTVQSYTDGRYKAPFTLSGEMLFRNRDRVRLNIRSPQTGYLYILNRGPANGTRGANYNILFPSPTANKGSSLLYANDEIEIPRQSWFELDTEEGTEFVWLIWTVSALPDLESAARFANPDDKGRIKDTLLTRSIESLLRQHEPSKAVVERDDDKKESKILGNADIVVHLIRLEHH